ncbi:hypothetical protein EVAR_37271_1 [Eumeta japonica]|uniref:Uncharacterized protein n=1 Tax=Eumeta variegata TaxID=151549 RepID=A0A4C1WMR9_EUMVA|nr:hypothetical protein EVAR_37271_1 [Eumeta japonica]
MNIYNWLPDEEFCDGCKFTVVHNKSIDAVRCIIKTDSTSVEIVSHTIESCTAHVVASPQHSLRVAPQDTTARCGIRRSCNEQSGGGDT